MRAFALAGAAFLLAQSLALSLALSGQAAAQNLSLEAPAWAQPLTAADIIPTTGGRAVLAADGVDVSVRVTIAPKSGGVARVIRYDARGANLQLALRRFTGHSATGWWLWGSDAPQLSTPAASVRQEIASLARAAMGVSGAVSTNSNTGAACTEQAFVEIHANGQSTSATRDCVSSTEAIGRLALRLSELGGSRSEEELAAAAMNELMAADRAFAALAAREGVPAAFARYAASDALLVTSGSIASGADEVAQTFAQWPQGARLEWAPETGRVSARGDMGWTWGNSVRVGADGTRTPGRYVSVWTRDYEGNWRFSFDAPIR
jgi:ketosteroid isomerase-like protein